MTQGYYEDNVFHVMTLGGPPAEDRVHSMYGYARSCGDRGIVMLLLLFFLFGLNVVVIGSYCVVHRIVTLFDRK